MQFAKVATVLRSFETPMQKTNTLPSDWLPILNGVQAALSKALEVSDRDQLLIDDPPDSSSHSLDLKLNAALSQLEGCLQRFSPTGQSKKMVDQLDAALENQQEKIKEWKQLLAKLDHSLSTMINSPISMDAK